MELLLSFFQLPVAFVYDTRYLSASFSAQIDSVLNLCDSPVAGSVIRELKNHDEVHDDDVRWLGKDWNENVGFGEKKES